ncbi:hypothetical protein F4604DRAFT_1826217, partial [Suillus subluteus]
MKFTLLTTVIITAAAMTGVVVASVIHGPKLRCDHGKQGCSKGVGGYNKGNDFVFICSNNGYMMDWTPCHCKNCCYRNEVQVGDHRDDHDDLYPPALVFEFFSCFDNGTLLGTEQV